MPVDLAPGEKVPWAQGNEALNNEVIAFQYWPDTVQDSKGSEWSARNVPGGSHPLYQWTHGGERRVSFTAVFTTDTMPDDDTVLGVDILGGLLGGAADPYHRMSDRPFSGIQLGFRDIDLRAVISWLRWFEYPWYGTAEQQFRAYEPAKALLVMPNMGMAHNGDDSLLTVMTQCDVTYEACFPNGFPRIIEVTLEFAEVVQSAERVQFHNRRDMTGSTFIRRYLGPRAVER